MNRHLTFNVGKAEIHFLDTAGEMHTNTLARSSAGEVILWMIPRLTQLDWEGRIIDATIARVQQCFHIVVRPKSAG